MKKHLAKLLSILVLSALFVSCNTGNKVVSSFGKRKYTKGYYFNLGAYKKQELPGNTLNTISEIPNHPIAEKERKTSLKDKTKPFFSATGIASVSQKKINLLNPAQIATDKKQHTAVTNNSENKLSNADGFSPYGVPGHRGTKEVTTRYDKNATIGFVFGILSIVITPLFAIPGIFFCISGLKSEKHHTLAVVGLVLNIVAIVLIIAVILLLVVLGVL